MSEPISITAPDILQAASAHNACAGQHFGPWCIEPLWFTRAVAAVNAGTWPRVDAASASARSAAEQPYNMIGNDVALIRIIGQMSKGASSFGGASTIKARQQIRAALADADVKGILLAIDSPGGTAAGTQELADDVYAANQTKPTHAFIEDLGASAAYWAASQAGRVSSNRIAQIGSIGTVAVIEDLSAAAEQLGIRVHVISTGPYKGMGVEGAEVTDEQLEHVQEIVDDINANFLASVKRGRNVGIDTVRSWADGRVWVGPKAQAVGLIDAVETFDEAVKSLRAAVRSRTPKESPRADRDGDIRTHRLQHAESSLRTPQQPGRRVARDRAGT